MHGDVNARCVVDVCQSHYDWRSLRLGFSILKIDWYYTFTQHGSCSCLNAVKAFGWPSTCGIYRTLAAHAGGNMMNVEKGSAGGERDSHGHSLCKGR